MTSLSFAHHYFSSLRPCVPMALTAEMKRKGEPAFDWTAPVYPDRQPLMDKYFPNVKVKEVEVTQETLTYLKKLSTLLELIDNHRKFWSTTQGLVTLGRLAQVESTLFAIAMALKATDFKLERFAVAVYGKSLKEFIKAIRCPVTTDENMKRQVREARRTLQNGLVDLLHGLFDICQASSATTYTHFINVDRKDLLTFIKHEEEEVLAADVNEDFVDAEVIQGAQNPPDMYS